MDGFEWRQDTVKQSYPHLVHGLRLVENLRALGGWRLDDCCEPLQQIDKAARRRIFARVLEAAQASQKGEDMAMIYSCDKLSDDLYICLDHSLKISSSTYQVQPKSGCLELVPIRLGFFEIPLQVVRFFAEALNFGPQFIDLLASDQQQWRGGGYLSLVPLGQRTKVTQWRETQSV